MSPDQAYMEKQAQQEEEKLQRQIQTLSDSDRREIYEKGNSSAAVGGSYRRLSASNSIIFFF